MVLATAAATERTRREGDRSRVPVAIYVNGAVEAELSVGELLGGDPFLGEAADEPIGGVGGGVEERLRPPERLRDEDG